MAATTFEAASQFAPQPLFAGTPAFPHKSLVIDHLKLFSHHHKLPIEYGVEVRGMTFNGDHWTVETNAGIRTANHVVVATGRDRIPDVPQWKGMEGFSGKIIHSAFFGDARDFAARRILVVGAGNSGVDVLNHLVKVDTSCIWLSARRGPTLLPKRFFNVPVHLISPLIACLPLRIADGVMAATQRLAFGDLTKFGMPAPPRGGASRLTSDYTAIATDDGAVRAIRAGRIVVLPQVKEFTRNGVILSDGNHICPDVVIAATGYRTGLEQMVGNLGVLDGKGMPLFNGGQCDPQLPGLWFTGMRPDIRGCFVNARIQARAVAKAIARFGH